MITGSHVILYANDADEARAFFRDVLEMPNLDVHGGWLIFKLPPAELGIHPDAAPGDPESGATNGRHELYLMCDDLERTVADLTEKGAEFSGPVEEAGFGSLTRLRVPGAGEIGLYQPKHQTAHDLPS